MRVRVFVLLLMLLALMPASQADPEEATLAECDERVARSPHDLESYQCYRQYAERARDKPGASAHLEARLALDPDNPHLKVVLARVLPFQQRERSISLLGEAIEHYEESGNRKGESYAYCYRSWFHLIGRDYDSAGEDARIGQARAEEIDDQGMVLFCRMQESRPEILKGDMASAWGLLRSIELHPSFKDTSLDLHTGTLDFLGVVAANLGLYEAALRYRERLIEIGIREELPDVTASGYSGAAFVASRLLQTGDISREEAYEFGKQAVKHARHPMQKRYARMQLAAVAPWDVAKPLLEELLEDPADSRRNLLTIMGTRMIEEEPESYERGERYLIEVLDDARKIGNPLHIASSLSNLSQARLRYRPDAEALALGEQTLDAIETLQGWQTGETIGAVLFGRFAPQYYELFDKLIDDWQMGNSNALEEAFMVSERYRSRALRAHLERLGAFPELEDEHAQRLDETLRAITELQLRILRGEGGDDDQEAWSREALRLEEEARLLRARASAREVRGGGELPSRRQIQDALQANEGLLSFMSSSDPALESWALLLTPSGLSAYPIPARKELESSVRLWLGLVIERDPAEAAGAARLWADLLEQPLSGLPEGITRLVIVPDGPLHELPFDALRPSPGEESLGERFELALAPSGTVWKTLREGREAPETRVGQGLFVADPTHPISAESPALLRGMRDSLRGLGPLPHARDEARAARRELGPGIEILEGTAATEKELKTRPLDGIRLLHFAAHSLLDAEVPERSSVLMAPGQGEDGLLQAREILALDLDRALVTLSACQSAAGRPVNGEGVLGLSRAFFQAGASTVIGSLWPIRDDEAAAFMRDFYARVGRGASPIAALTDTKRALAARGAAPASWAGVVLIGEAESLAWPENEGRRSASVGLLFGSALAMLAIAAALLFMVSRARMRS